MPPESERAQRLGAVLHVLYLIFTRGLRQHVGGTSVSHRPVAEAIRLARLAHHLLPDDGEVTGLLALMLLTDARRPARAGPNGELIPLEEQDRTLWNAAAIAEGVALITAALPKGTTGPLPAPGRDRGASTTKRRAPRRPTGRRSSRCTSC